jgi:hypothetical protein
MYLPPLFRISFRMHEKASASVPKTLAYENKMLLNA